MADKVFIELDVETKKALQALTQINQKVDTFGKNAEKNFNKSSQAFNVFIGGLASRGAAAALSAISRYFGEAFDESLQFNKSLLEIQTILPQNTKLTNDQVKALKDLATEYATSRQEQAKAFYQIISAGVTDTVQAQKLLVAANKTALGGLSDLRGSIDILTDIINVYGQNNITAAEASDILFTTVQKGKTDISQLQASLGKVLPSAQVLGVGFTELASTLATLTTKGQSTSDNVTLLSSLFTSLNKNQETAKKVLGDNADLFSLQALRTKGLTQYLQDLNQVLGGSSEAWFKLLGRSEAVNAVLKLSSDGFVTLKETQKDFVNVSGAATKAADELKKSLDFKLDKASRNIKDLTGAILDDLNPALIWGVDAVNTFFDSQGINLKETEQLLDSYLVSLNDLEVQIENLKKQEAPVEFIQPLEARAEGLKKIIDSLDAKLTKLEGATPEEKPAGKSDTVEKQKEEYNTLQALQQAHFEVLREQKKEEEDLAAEEKILKNDADFEYLAEVLGREEALKIAYQARELERMGKHTEAKKLLEDKFREAEKKDIRKQRAFEDLTQKEREANFATTMQNISRLSNSENKALFLVGKAAALSLAYVRAFQAHNIALASAPPPVSFALAAATDVSSAAAIAGILGVKFAQGGILEGSQSGDKNIAQFNGGEMFLNKRQQENLFKAIDEDNVSKGAVTYITIQGDVIASEDEHIERLAARLTRAVEDRNVTLTSSKVA